MPSLASYFPYKISIHALREESDSVRASIPRASSRISIHALREESDKKIATFYSWFKFQSTLSVRRATTAASTPTTGSQFQSTLSVRRATGAVHDGHGDGLFQSTLSVRRATHRLHGRNGHLRHFNPRSP